MHVFWTNNVLGSEKLQFHQREMLPEEVPMISSTYPYGDTVQTQQQQQQ
jgi:hypothetical protein